MAYSRLSCYFFHENMAKSPSPEISGPLKAPRKKASIGQVVGLAGLGLVAGAEGVSKAMEAVAQVIAEPILKGVRNISHTSVENPTTRQRAHAPEGNVGDPPQPSAASSQGEGVSMRGNESETRIVLPAESREEQVIGDWSNGEVVTQAIWNDEGFQALRTSQDVAAYLRTYLERICDGQDDTCDPTTLRYSLQKHLGKRLQRMVSADHTSAARAMTIARGLRTMAHGNSDGEGYCELDAALESRDVRLVEEALHAPQNPAAGTESEPATTPVIESPTAYFSPERLEALVAIYPRLSVGVQEAIRSYIQGMLTSARTTLESAEESPELFSSGYRRQMLVAARRDLPVFEVFLQIISR